MPTTEPTTVVEEALDLKQFLSSVRLKPEIEQPRPMLQSNLEKIVEEVSAEERFISSMAAVVYNLDPSKGRFDKQSIQDLVASIDELVDAQINEILHNPTFQNMESNW